MKLKLFLLAIIVLLLSSNLFSQDCQAWFYSQQDTLDYLKFYFYDGSIPENSIDTYEWDFGDGETSSEQNPVHFYATGGSYLVKLTITAGDCQDIFTEIVYVLDRPLCFADFTYYSDLQSLTVEFENLSEVPNPETADWYWNFGDGESSTQMNPTHTYDADTTYFVTLSVISDECSSNFTQLVFLGDDYFGDDCISMFSYEPLDPAQRSFQFWDFSWQGNDTIISYLWEFGDGAYSTETNPIHTYNTTREYEVALTIETNNCTNTSVNYIYTGDSAWYSNECQALFWFEENQNNPYELQFNDISYAEGGILEWYWDFGDGQSSYLQNPNHTFNSEDTFDVKLSILTEDMCENDFTMRIRIDEDTTYCEDCHTLFYPIISGKTVHFYDLSRGEPTWWHWNFGDGNTSSMQNPTYTFDELGVHRVAFSTGNGNCGNSLLMDIYLEQKGSSAKMSYAIPYSMVSVSNPKSIKFNIFPNPANDFININLPENTNGIISIYNSSGQLILETNFDKSQISKQIDIAKLQSGLYIIKLQSAQNIGVLKFVK